MLVLVGIEKGDTEDQARQLSKKVASFRFFPDAAGRMNQSIVEARGEALVVSQVTLVPQPRKGNRPSFDGAAPSREAQRLYRVSVEALSAEGGVAVREGVFGAMMDVELVNSGPVTFVFEARSGVD
jgi:D-tyrosyl-tRNA(Tyr) deacylase